MTELMPQAFFDLSTFRHAALFENITFVWEVIPLIKSYLATQLLGRQQGAIIDPKAYIINPEQISIGIGTVIEPGAYIKGPCIIGDHCVVRHGAYIRGNFICGDNCVIGHDTEIKNSVFLNGTQAAHFAYVGDSLLGNKVNLGAGTKCANLTLNHSFISISFRHERILTNLKKCGAVIGDNSQVGCNAVLNPGTLMGKHVLCYPCLNPKGYISPYSIIKPPLQPFVVEKNNA